MQKQWGAEMMHELRKRLYELLSMPDYLILSRSKHGADKQTDKPGYRCYFPVIENL
jgi:hypothetical protein